MTVQVHGADIQDRDGAPGVLASVRHPFPKLRHVFADRAYAGPKLACAVSKSFQGAGRLNGRWHGCVAIVGLRRTLRRLLAPLKSGSFSPAYNSSSGGWQDYEKQ